MTDDLTLTVQHTDGPLALIAVAGEIDIETAPALRAQALHLIAQGHPHLVLDCTRVTFCDSTGFSALIGILRCAKADNGSLTLACVPDRLARMLDLTGISTLMPSYPNATDALNARTAAGKTTAP
ncbi:STAS domain-containing protein [Streptomyces sp. NPDC056296]|uniref:STAS domain-containing protein n=1 Tax=Streptomyces sp. NPDC056296 TaxID=3345775 RepID=UPI0035D9474B